MFLNFYKKEPRHLLNSIFTEYICFTLPKNTKYRYQLDAMSKKKKQEKDNKTSNKFNSPGEFQIKLYSAGLWHNQHENKKLSLSLLQTMALEGKSCKLKKH